VTTRTCEICKKDFSSERAKKCCSQDCEKKRKSIINKKFHEKNKEKTNLQRREYYKKNRQKVLDRQKAYRKTIEDELKEYRKRKRKEEIEERIKNGEKVRGHNLVPQTKEQKKKITEEQKKQYNKRRRDRYNKDKVYNLAARVRARINAIIRKKEWHKSTSTEEYLGCDLETLRKHIENNFTDGMTWENRDKWQIDHIVPISNAKNEEEFKLLSNYKNLQPLWSKDNLKKSNKIGIHGVTSSISKKYKGREELQQYRYEKIVQFRCAQCGKEKKSKLIVVTNNDWEKIICNGCYGTNLM
tara:strand:- start:182 stop:1078 length:897 start_codon:yes stop_codon:yes gene_type:complete